MAAVSNGVSNVFQDIPGGPGLVFGTGSVINWGLVIVGAGLIWKAAGLVYQVESAQREAMHSIRSLAQKATDTAYLLEKHMSEVDERAAKWEPFLLRLKIKEEMEIARNKEKRET